MCTAPYHSALLCICSSVLAAAVAGADLPPATAAELELGLARRPQLYLVVDLEAGTLEVKARGMTFDAVSLREVSVAALQPVLGPERWPELTAPALWRVSRPPAGDWRPVIAPPALRQYSELAAAPATGSTTPPETEELPSRYSFEVDSGWQVVLTQQPEGGLWRRALHAAVDSWRRWSGRESSEAAPRLVLSMAAEDARRLLHVIQSGLPILLTSHLPAQPVAGGAR